MITLNITDEYRIIVPLRFQRFNHGELARRDCPEIDDRGSLMARTSSWGAPTIRGPLFGVCRGDTVKVKVIREDIDGDCPLFATSSDAAILEIKNTDARIGVEGELRVEGKSRGTATIQVRLGAVDGPIMAEADARVHTIQRITIKPWIVRIDTSSATGTTPTLNTAPIIERCRAIWRPAGIHLALGSSDTVHVTLPTGTLNQVNLHNANWVTEIARVLALQNSSGPAQQAIHWFIIREFTPGTDFTFTGQGWSRRTSNANIDPATGVAVPDTGIITSTHAWGNPIDPDPIANTLAHEVGHFFRLEHVQRRNNDNPAPDSYSRKQLMFPLDNLSGGTGDIALPRFDNVGYGDGARGALLTMKNHDHHSTDGEVATARNAINGANWF